MSALPFQPEPLDRLQARFAEAFEPVYNPFDASYASMTRPGQQRKHVFDFEDGMRLIASVEVQCFAGEMMTVLHVSVSWHERHPHPQRIEALFELLAERIEALLGFAHPWFAVIPQPPALYNFYFTLPQHEARA